MATLVDSPCIAETNALQTILNVPSSCRSSFRVIHGEFASTNLPTITFVMLYLRFIRVYKRFASSQFPVLEARKLEWAADTEVLITFYYQQLNTLTTRYGIWAWGVWFNVNPKANAPSGHALQINGENTAFYVPSKQSALYRLSLLFRLSV